jgi:predicted DNA-binding transcriptional regulator YafY
MHETQKVLKQNAQNLDIEIEVGITPELIQDILSYGNKVQVLSPKILIEQIKKSLEDTTAHYI